MNERALRVEWICGCIVHSSGKQE